MSNDAQTLIEILDHFDTAMLVTALNGAEPHARPMSIANRDDDGTLWFITSRDTRKADEVDDDGRAMVTLQSVAAYATVHGHAELIEDDAKIRDLWSPTSDLFWPDGPDQEDVVLLRFTPTTGHYWDMRGAKGVKYAFEALKALAAGNPIDSVDGIQGHATLH